MKPRSSEMTCHEELYHTLIVSSNDDDDDGSINFGHYIVLFIYLELSHVKPEVYNE